MATTSYSSGPHIEEDHRKPRTLVLCFDGTANEFSRRNTNVVRLYSILKKDAPKSQLCYYQAGVGTYFQPGVVSPFFRIGAKILDEMFAWYLSEHIMDGYKFLMQNYHEGDTVCIFGFSRGAYTARALAGMLHKVGLLSKDNLEQVWFAYRLYKCSSRKDNKLAVQFKQAFSREVPIDFLGVWDTVASVGILSGNTLPFVGTNSTIKWFRQALSLDERRAKFRPNLYHRPALEAPKKPHARPPARGFLRIFSFFTSSKSRDTPHHHQHKHPHGKESDTNKRVLEVWFAGSHSDVGGGLTKDTKQRTLANISLRWMVREIMKTGTHILFDESGFKQWSIPTSIIRIKNGAPESSDATLYTEPPRAGELEETPGSPLSEPSDLSDNPDDSDTPDDRVVALRRGTITGVDELNEDDYFKEATAPVPQSVEEALDSLDAVKKMGNQMKKNVFWWLLEIVPTYYEWQNENDKWVGGWSFNRGRGRQIPSNPPPLFHESVRTRIMDPYLDYNPAARYEKGIEEYVM